MPLATARKAASCHHGVPHPHGSVGRARSDGCRCELCEPVARAYDRRRRRARAYGTWAPWVDAAQVADHLRVLRRVMSMRAVADAAGLDHAAVDDILAGTTRRVRADNAQAILAVTPQPDAGDSFALVDAAAAAAAVRDLASRRMPLRMIADSAGVSLSTVRRVMAARDRSPRPLRVQAWVGEALEALPRELGPCLRALPRLDPARTHPVVRSAADLAAAGMLAAEQRRAAVAVLTRERVGAASAAALLRVSERTVWRDRAAIAA